MQIFRDLVQPCCFYNITGNIIYYVQIGFLLIKYKTLQVSANIYIYIYIYSLHQACRESINNKKIFTVVLEVSFLKHLHTGCSGENVPDFGRMFLKLKYSDISQNTYIRIWTVIYFT